MSHWQLAAVLCWRLWRRWTQRRGWWLVERRPADGSPVFRAVTQEQLSRLMKAVRTEFVDPDTKGS